MLNGHKTSDGSRGLPLVTLKVMSSPTQRELCWDKVTRRQSWELSGCTVWPRLGCSCQTLLAAVRLSCLDSVFKAKWLHRRALHISRFFAWAQSKPLDVGSDFGILKQIKMKNELCQGRLVLCFSAWQGQWKKYLITKSWPSSQPIWHPKPR